MQIQLTRRELEVLLIERSWKDSEFKAKLITDPKLALQELGYTLPTNIKISIIQENNYEMTFVLPTAPVEVKTISNCYHNSEADTGGKGFTIDNFTTLFCGC